MRIEIDIKNWLKGEIKKNNIFLKKKQRKKIKNQNNEDQIKKYDTINLNRRMKLKTNNVFTKG